jgi:FkbM family methyltransferase
MMGFSIFFYDYLTSIGTILRFHRGLGEKLYFAYKYSKVLVKGSVSRVLGLKFTSESIRGLKVSFFKYSQFASMFSEIFINQTYLVKKKRQARIIDCGSNIGISVLFFKYHFPDAKVICFEPEPMSFAMLKQNVEQNKLKNVRLVNAAVSNKSETLTFYGDASEKGSTSATLQKELLASSAIEEMKVKAVKLSEFITERVDLLKLDIEGAENKVVSELVSSGKISKVDQIIMEYHVDRANENSLGSIISMLEKAGFNTVIYSQARAPFFQHKNKNYIFMIYAYRKE